MILFSSTHSGSCFFLFFFLLRFFFVINSVFTIMYVTTLFIFDLDKILSKEEYV